MIAAPQANALHPVGRLAACSAGALPYINSAAAYAVCTAQHEPRLGVKRAAMVSGLTIAVH